jgi:hypothetical protein
MGDTSDILDVQTVGEIEDPETKTFGDQGAEESKSDRDLLDDVDDETDEVDEGASDEPDSKSSKDTPPPAAKKAGEEKAEGEEEEEVEDNPLPGRPAYKELKAAYPDLFKKFPGLRDAIFREQKFAEHFPTVEDAATAATKADNYDVLEASVVNGDPSLIYTELSRNNPEAFGKLVENLLPSLMELDRKAYVRATFPVLEDLIRSAYEDGKRSNDKNLMYAAGHLAKHVFGKPDIPEHRVKTGPHPAEVQLREERERHQQERSQAFSQELSSAAYTELSKLASQGIGDPEKKLTDFVRKAIIRDSLAELDEQLTKDPALGRTLKQLWKRASQGGFTREHQASILSAHLARAKQLLPVIRNRKVTEALGVPSTTDNKDKQKRTVSDGRSARAAGPSTPRPQEIDWGKTSDEDILSDRVTLRKR